MNAPGKDAEFARADAVAALAREFEVLRRAVDPLREIGGRVEDLARLVGQLGDKVAALSQRPGPAPAPTWLLLPVDRGAVERILGELCAWMRAVFLRYPDGVAALPECWMRHPDVVEELLWLMHAWCAAYQGKAASVQSAGDWHDRQRPGVVRRLRLSAGSCSIERHQTREDWDQHPTGAVPVPGAAGVPAIAVWWAEHRDDPAPEPAPHGAGFATNGVTR